MAGYSATPLIAKLGIKDGYAIKLYHEPENYFKLLGKLPDKVKVISGKKLVNFIHLFITQEKELLKQLPQVRNLIEKDGMIWVSWPKKSSRQKTDLDENKIRNFALKIGLVDVKVCAIDEVWSGLKLVYRLVDRK